MFWIIFSLIVIGAIFTVTGFKKTEQTSRYGGTHEVSIFKLNKKQFLAIFGLLVLLPGFFTIIPANSVGILYSPFGGTKEETLSEGFKSKNLFDKIYTLTTEVQTIKVTGLTTQTKDAQYLTSELDIKYRVSDKNAFLIFKQYRTIERMSNSLIIPTTQRVLELITTQYNIISILGEKRGEIYEILRTNLTEEFNKYGIEFHSISIIDMDAGEALEKAITEEAIAKKAVETAQQNLLKVETEAKQKTIQAQAEQEAAKIKAETQVIEAEATKKANEMLNQTLTSTVLQKEWIEKWNGVVPVVVGSSNDIILNEAIFD